MRAPVGGPGRPLSAVVLLLASIGGLMMFIWPLLISAEPQPTATCLGCAVRLHGDPAGAGAAGPGQLGDGGMDTKALAMLGVLAAINAALRPLGAGLNGIETVFFLLILAGRVFGPGFGFLLGCTSLFASALLTAGVGPVVAVPDARRPPGSGSGAGLLPRRMFGRPINGAGEIALLAGYGVLAAYVFGALMNMWFWPFVTGAMGGDLAGLAYIPGGPLGENLHHFLMYTLLTSTLGLGHRSGDHQRRRDHHPRASGAGGAAAAAHQARFRPPVAFHPAATGHDANGFHRSRRADPSRSVPIRNWSSGPVQQQHAGRDRQQGTTDERPTAAPAGAASGLRVQQPTDPIGDRGAGDRR